MVMAFGMALKPLALSAAKIALAAYGGICLLLYVRQARMVYYPAREIAQTPAAAGLAYEELSLKTSDGEKIGAWFVPAKDARGAVLICHGNAGNIGDRLHAIELCHGLGLDVLIFDYRGYGRSTGTPTERGTYEDALAAWNYLVGERGVPAGKIVVFGRSLGGGVASWLAARQAPGALILEATFTSIPDTAARLYPWLPVRLLCRFRYPTLEHVRQVRCPVLVAHSPQDELLPFAGGRKLFDAAPEPKVFVELAGGHNDGESFTSPAYRQTLDEFLGSVLP